MAPALPLHTARLILRPFRDDDLAELFLLQSDADVSRYLPWGPRTREEVLRVLEHLKGLTGIDETHEALRLAAVERASGSLVGDYSLWLRSREHRQGEIGFVTHPDHQGRGFATEAASELLRVGFDELGLHRIVASCDARNTPSARVMERLGMRREAHFRENERLKGEWTDELVYAVLASEFRTAS